MDINTTISTTITQVQTETTTSVQSKSSDTSFKDEMNKVSTAENEDTAAKTETTDSSENVDAKTNKEEISQNNEKSDIKNSEDTEIKNQKFVSDKSEDKITEDMKTQISSKYADKMTEDTKTQISGKYADKMSEDNIKSWFDRNDSENQISNANPSVIQATLLTGQVSELENMDSVQTLLDANSMLESITQKTVTPTKVDYSVIEMGEDDAKFFSDLVKDTDATLQQISNEIQRGVESEVQNVTKHVKVSATLMNALSEATKTNQPFRIDFDKDVSVIIKVDRDGSLSAKFIPGDKAVEEYLKQNISALRQKFDDQELPYKELSYSNQQQRKNRRNNNKENG